MTLVICSSPLARVAEWLAGITADEHVEVPKFVTSERAHVLVFGDVRPMFCEDAQRVWVDLYLADACQSGPLEAEIEPTNAGEKA